MSTGVVKWFAHERGYGFIGIDGSPEKDVFVHITAVQRAGLRTLNEGSRLEFEIMKSDNGRLCAINLVPVN